MTAQQTITKQLIETDWQERQAKFAQVRAQILQVINKAKTTAEKRHQTFTGLTRQQIQVEFYAQYRYFPVIDNRLRELTNDKHLPHYLKSMTGPDGLLHYYPLKEEDE